MLCIFLLLRKSFGEIYRKQRSDPSPRSWAHWPPCEAMRDQGLLGPWIHSASQICLICSQIISNPHAGVNNQITNGLVKKKSGQQIDESNCYNCLSHNGKPMIDSDSHDCQITMILKAQEDFRPQKFPELPAGSNISILSSVFENTTRMQFRFFSHFERPRSTRLDQQGTESIIWWSASSAVLLHVGYIPWWVPQGEATPAPWQTWYWTWQIWCTTVWCTMVHYGALWYTNARYSALWPVKVIGVLKLYIYIHIQVME